MKMLFKKERGNKKSRENIVKTNLDIMPVREYDVKLNAFILQDSNYLDLLEIIPKDRGNLKDEELQYEIYMFQKFFRLYLPDHKIISLNFPINTKKQRNNLEFAIENTLDPIRKEWLEREIRELESLEETVTRREFYFMYFGYDKNSFVKNKSNVIRWTNRGRSKLLKEMNKGKKIQIITKLNNMNSLIIPNYFEKRED